MLCTCPMQSFHSHVGGAAIRAWKRVRWPVPAGALLATGAMQAALCQEGCTVDLEGLHSEAEASAREGLQEAKGVARLAQPLKCKIAGGLLGLNSRKRPAKMCLMHGSNHIPCMEGLGNTMQTVLNRNFRSFAKYYLLEENDYGA